MSLDGRAGGWGGGGRKRRKRNKRIRVFENTGRGKRKITFSVNILSKVFQYRQYMLILFVMGCMIKAIH